MSARPRFDGKVALITGGSAGIGLATAKAFAREGASVVIAARRTEEGERAAAEIAEDGGTAIFVRCDVADEDDIRSLVDQTVRAFGRLDIAFNNAGITGTVGASITETDAAQYDQVMGVNARGVWLSMKYEIDQMLASGGGNIVNCSSTAGLRGGPGSSAYYASKHAVIGMTKSVALEFAQQRIRVNAICPGLIETELVRDGFADKADKLARLMGLVPMGRMGDVAEVAKTVLWLASEESSYVSGVALPVDGLRSV